MSGDPFAGVALHWLGGLASASFYVPYRFVRGWSWEVFWLTGGLVSWLVAPWLFAAVQTHDLLAVIGRTPVAVKGWCVAFGVLWGFGGLTYGLTMRYLGLSLGTAVVLGLCTVFGTLAPPLVRGEAEARLLQPLSGRLVLAGLAVTLLGIALVAWGGLLKDRAQPAGDQAAAVPEFALGKGLALAVFSGVMSSCFAFGLSAGEPVKALAAATGTPALWRGLPTLCLVMFGGLLTNAAWCLAVVARRRSAGEWAGRASTPPALLTNYALCAAAGLAWYMQFFFYTMGESQMGSMGFASWTLHMASIVLFGTAWGFGLKEWRGAPAAARRRVYAGVALLVLSTLVIGGGNRLAAQAPSARSESLDAHRRAIMRAYACKLREA